MPPTRQQQRVVEKYLTTGRYDDVKDSVWPGDTIFQKMKATGAALEDALVAEVKKREQNVRLPPLPSPEERVRMTRTRIEPMVRGLFPRVEQELVLGLLEKSVVFLTPDTIEGVLRKADYAWSAWDVANLYLLSIRAELLGKDAMRIVGLSEATTCFVTAEYLAGRGKFDDFVVHEAAHIFHNWKREYAGLPHTRYKEWLLEIAFRKRETFAYTCEVYARILEQSRSPQDRQELHEEYASKPFSSDDLDYAEHIDILRGAVKARNGWKVILRCVAPPPPPTRKEFIAASLRRPAVPGE